MSANLYLHLPPGALSADDLASLSVSWWRADASAGDAKLGELLAASPASVALILSAADVHLAEVEMTRQQARHLKKILPFLLEDSLLDASEDLLFVASSGHGGRYQVAALKQEPLARLALFVRDQGWRVSSIAVDADLLAASSPCLLALSAEWLLLDGERQAVVLDEAGLELFFAQQAVARAQFTEFDRPSAQLQLQQRIAQGGYLELMQRQWQLPSARPSAASSSWLNWKPTLIAACVLLLLIWLGVGVQTWRYHLAEQQWQAKSAQLFAELFPQDRATAKLRAQFASHLTRLERGQGGADFLGLMRAAGPVLAQQKTQGVNPERIQYDQRSGELLLDITASSYDALQTLRSQLQAVHLKTEISVAKTQAKGVSARLVVEQG